MAAPEKKDFKLSIVVPVYNEEKYIDQVIERLLAVQFPPGISVELVAVDDCSKDNSWAQLQKWKARGVSIAHHDVNGGKGAALHTGFKLATGDAVTIQDADFEYDPEDLTRVVMPIYEGKADAVFGARPLPFFRAANIKEAAHSFINIFLTVFSNLFSGFGLHDMECCYKMFRKEYLDQLTLRENRFGFEPEVTLKFSRLRRPICEVPVKYAPRGYSEGKKINWKDGVSAMRCILKYGLFRQN